MVNSSVNTSGSLVLTTFCSTTSAGVTVQPAGALAVLVTVTFTEGMSYGCEFRTVAVIVFSRVTTLFSLTLISVGQSRRRWLTPRSTSATTLTVNSVWAVLLPGSRSRTWMLSMVTSLSKVNGPWVLGSKQRMVN